MQRGAFAVPEVAQEIRGPARAREERLAHSRGVETRHRPAVEAERARGEDEITALQRAVAHRRLGDQRLLAFVPALRVGVREELRELVEETQVQREDRGHGRGLHLLDVARGHARKELGLRLGARDEHDAQRARIRGRRAPTQQVVQLVQQLRLDRARLKGVMRARVEEELVESGLVERGRGGDVHGADANVLSVLPLALVVVQAPQALSPEAEKACFSLAPGCAIELVLSEPHARKVVDVNFDDAGRMWAVTASEYPLDGNEDARAAELYRSGGHDQVLVVERPWGATCTTPRVFADGLVMPMAVLPLEFAAIVQHGPEILKLVDDDHDGRAERREVLLSGFGIEDSHLLPHRFLRGPDGWIYMAQGAFNHSLVRDRSGRETRFDFCKVGRFREDGSRFELVATGLNNIWGLVFDERGEFLAQEANDMGYGVVPLVHGASFPGIGQDRFRPFGPVHPPGTELRFGGTGLSGLAFAEGLRYGLFEPLDGPTVVLANPIERKVQAVLWRGRGSQSKFTSLRELVTSTDPCFRPVAVHYGPHEDLYIVDWYNPIISHNEVPRTHPDRDKLHTRVWRMRHAAQGARPALADATTANEEELKAQLVSRSQFEARAAWHQIVAREELGLAGFLTAVVRNAAELGTAERLRALWCLEGLQLVDLKLAAEMLADAAAPIRRCAVRAFAASAADFDTLLALPRDPGADPDLEVRCEWLRALASAPADEVRALERLLARVPAPDERESAVAEQDRVVTLTGRSLEGMRERMWIRIALEGREQTLERWVDTDPPLSAEARALAALALGPAAAFRLVEALAELEREPSNEELALLASGAADERVLAELVRRLAQPGQLRRIVDAFGLAAPLQFNASARAALARAVRELADPALCVKVATHFELDELGPELLRIASDSGAERTLRRDALRGLQRLHIEAHEACMALVDQSLPGDELQGEALSALASDASPEAIAATLERLPSVPRAFARRAASQLALHRPGADALLAALLAGDVDRTLANERLLASLEALASSKESLQSLREQLGHGGRAVLVLAGGARDAIDSNLALSAPFSIEAWVQVHEGVDNREGVLALPGAFDFNFAGGRPRLYLGPERGDVLIARTRLEPGRWTHVALTASAEGALKLYIDGLLDVEARAGGLGRFEGLDVARTTPGHGRLSLCEVRVWSRERSAGELALDMPSTLDGPRPSGLLARFPGDEARLDGDARIQTTFDAPALADHAAQAARLERFERYAALARTGDAKRGPEVFSRTCAKCHSVGGVGESVGPPLDGIQRRGLEGVLAALLEPSAAMEAGYRVFRVDFTNETATEGLLVREDADSVTLRPANADGAQAPLVIPRSEIARVRVLKLSLMPEGQLEAMGDKDAADLLAYVLGL